MERSEKSTIKEHEYSSNKIRTQCMQQNGKRQDPGNTFRKLPFQQYRLEATGYQGTIIIIIIITDIVIIAIVIVVIIIEFYN